MDIGIFFTVLGAGVALVFIQGFLAWTDGFLTKAQMRSRGVNAGWSFLEHGGMWADVFLVSPIVAYLLAKYRLAFTSIWGLLVLACTLVLMAIMGRRYRHTGVRVPEAHAHGGRTTPAGWVHGAFAVIAFWTCGLFYLNLTTPRAAVSDVVGISTLLIVFCFLGVAKFSASWRFTTPDRWQIGAEVAALLVLACVQVWLS